MKKVILILIAVLIVTSCTATAFADNVENQIEKFVMQDKHVKDARVLCYKNYCVVAIQKRNFAEKTQYEQFKKDLASKITAKFDGITEVFVTASPRVMFEIDRIGKMDESEREKAIERFVEYVKNRITDLPDLPSELIRL